MAAKKMKVRGFKELERAINQLPKELMKKPVLFALRKGAQVIQADAKARVPVRSGDLKESIIVARANRKNRTRGQVIIGFRPPTSRRAHLTEFGTFNQPAQPFFRSALTASAPKVVAIFGSEMAKSIARISKKLAGSTLKKSGLKTK